MGPSYTRVAKIGDRYFAWGIEINMSKNDGTNFVSVKAPKFISNVVGLHGNVYATTPEDQMYMSSDLGETFKPMFGQLR